MLVKNMNEYLSNREIATAVWALIITVAALFLPKAKDIRKCLKSLITQAFARKFNIVYSFTLGYIVLILFGLSKIGLWDLKQFKTTFLWIVLSAIPTIFKTNSFKDREITFKSLVFDNFKLAVIVEIIVSAYVFGIIVELIMIPSVAVLVILIAFCENNQSQDTRVVHRFLNTLMIIIVFLLILHAFYGLYTDPKVLLTKQTLFDFLLPIILTITFIPFLYFLMVYSIYESTFISLNRFIKDPPLRKRAKSKAVILFNFRTDLLERWKKYAICKNINSHNEIDSSLKEILRINRNEKKENKVSIKDGWSPNEAKELLTEKELKTGYYNPPQYPEYDKSWFACSNMLQIDDGLPSNNISYHIEGCENVAKKLKLFVNVNNKEKAKFACNYLLEVASLLCKKAVNLDLSDGVKESILDKKSTYSEDHENFSINIEKDIWETGDGYSVSFSINHKSKFLSE